MSEAGDKIRAWEIDGYDPDTARAHELIDALVARVEELEEAWLSPDHHVGQLTSKTLAEIAEKLDE